jgi:hypothetical protein
MMNQPHSTEATYVDPLTSLMVNVLTGVFMTGFGILIMFLFWPIGIIIVLSGLISPFLLMTVKTLQGPCPY